MSNQPDSPFDRRLLSIESKDLCEAARHVHDTMELAFLSASEVLGAKATAEAVLGFYDRIQSERARLEKKPKRTDHQVVGARSDRTT